MPSAEENKCGEPIALVDRFSDLIRLQRTTAIILRMCPSRRDRRGNPFVTAAEMEDDLHMHLRQAQRFYFAEEYKLLQEKQPVANKSKLRELNPYLDDHGLIRVAGRLQNSKLPFRERNPLIVPKESSLCLLLISHAHTVTAWWYSRCATVLAKAVLDRGRTCDG